MTMVLDVSGVTKRFGGLTALSDVSFSLDRGKILGLVGPNGSGKSTMLNVLSGVYAPELGSVTLNGAAITGMAPNQITRAGLARTFQNLQLFGGLTIGQNVMVGRNCRMSSSLLGTIFGFSSARREEDEARETARTYLDFVGLADRFDDETSSLSYGERRLLEVARALAASPEVLMLDEPCAGLSQGEADDLADSIRQVAAQGISVIVIEHNMRFIMQLVDRIVALNFGQKIAEGTPQEIRANEDVIAAYLGRRHA
ncbi:ABC transporter ATP-binding protein [Microbaculum marinisediminis]|uniref:ABC transporter ATP-binding protein n=1 Tax=Microbaculum marinisediminis TaxID=2931392 RepID=A0AAW5R2U8_9HYPH|nr:ABC transporter ATP-binding protein [Microbaculum sp. A6E488]MCT8974586.1 ABC transporter ATP-binding protein [Microbaculum sp. A6E488]